MWVLLLYSIGHLAFIFHFLKHTLSGARLRLRNSTDLEPYNPPPPGGCGLTCLSRSLARWNSGTMASRGHTTCLTWRSLRRVVLMRRPLLNGRLSGWHLYCADWELFFFCHPLAINFIFCLFLLLVQTFLLLVPNLRHDYLYPTWGMITRALETMKTKTRSTTAIGGLRRDRRKGGGGESWVEKWGSLANMLALTYHLAVVDRAIRYIGNHCWAAITPDNKGAIKEGDVC